MSVKSNVPTPHIEARAGEIAETILLPGDPLRAKYIAENFLSDVKQFNSVRNMFGYTGTYEGRPVSVMGTGMGCPSMGIYSYELIHFYGVKNLIRVGTAGSIHPDVHIRDLVFGIGACTTSNFPALRRQSRWISGIKSEISFPRICSTDRRKDRRLQKNGHPWVSLPSKWKPRRFTRTPPSEMRGR